MASVHAFDAIRAFISDNWSDAAPVACPLAWDNEPFETPAELGPKDPVTHRSTPNAWGRVLIDGDMDEQQTVGGGDPAGERWDETGSVTLWVFFPAGHGSRTVRLLLTAFADLCRGQDIGAVEFQTIRFDPIGATDDTGKWWGMSASIDWIRKG